MNERPPLAKAKPGVTREKVKRLWSQGMNPRDIARKLDIAVQNVHYHMKRIREEEGE